MSLGRLWAGWRSSYVDGVANVESADDGSCVFCALGADEDDTGQVVARSPLTFVVLNIFPYTSGHLMVMPRRHVGDLTALTDEEATALMVMTRQATAAVQRAYTPDGINVGMNLGKAAGAGVPGHLHVHVVPRWSGDTNFMTSVAETRVLPEPLTQTFERLHAAWPT
jgi:ATP adenylyltransferase